MIIKPMAITRCPYCHAIIDENDKYCNNCGTQLLFTEDEEIEEEIPGEKIIDAEVEEKDYTVDEPEDEKRPAAAKDLDTEIDEELEKELREETEEMALDELVAEEAGGEAADDVTEEVILVDEIAASEAKDKEASREIEDKSVPEPMKEEEKDDEGEDEDAEDEEDEIEDEAEGPDKKKDEKIDEEKDEDEDIEEEDIAPTPAKEPVAVTPSEGTTEIPEPLGASEEIAEVEYVTGPADADFASTAGESALKPVTFDTRELEDLGKTVDLGQAQVDRFMEARTAREPAPGSPPEPPAPPQAEEKPAANEPPTGTLPPWASTMKGAPVFPADTGAVETRKIRGGEPVATDTEEEVEIFPRRKASDSTMGLPERVSQSPLPFGLPSDEEEIGDEGEEEVEAAVETEEEAAEPVRPAREPILPRRGAEGGEEIRREIEPLDESEEAGLRPPFSFSVFFKSKIFDVLFVGLFWLVALGLAAASMGLTFFEILGSMSGSMLLFYGVLVFLYFFLFKFFLGETLGDRLFRPRE
jgi:hypothetical protein